LQTLKTARNLIVFCGLLPLLVNCSFKPRGSFAEAVKKYRGTLVEEVGEAKAGAPFFSVHALNPIWKDAPGKIVKIPPLLLVDQDGRARSEEMFKGKISFVAFIFTSCNGFCPTLIRGLKGVADRIGSEGVQYVAITVDTERDTPERLRAFARQMGLATGESWTLLTGSHERIYSLVKDTFASQAFQKMKPGPRNFAHSEHFYVLDGEGRLRGILNGTRTDTVAEAGRLVAQLKATQLATTP
jgi:protein SCO1/2